MIDFEIVHDGDSFQVWTPDECGAIIGMGGTYRQAVADAIRSMEDCAARLKKLSASAEPSTPQNEAGADAPASQQKEVSGLNDTTSD